MPDHLAIVPRPDRTTFVCLDEREDPAAASGLPLGDPPGGPLRITLERDGRTRHLLGRVVTGYAELFRPGFRHPFIALVVME